MTTPPDIFLSHKPKDRAQRSGGKKRGVWTAIFSALT